MTLELGGNDAAIVLDDVDPKEVAPKIFMGAMLNAGQVCLAIKRVYVARLDLRRALRRAREARRRGGRRRRHGSGHADRPAAEQGAVREGQGLHRGRACARQDHRRRQGARSARATSLRPTIVRDIPDDARLVREEQFGPVLPVLRYSDIDDAIARANGTEYGLGGTVWGSDLEARLRGGREDRFRHRLGEQASRSAAGRSVRAAPSSRASAPKWATRASKSSRSRRSSTSRRFETHVPAPRAPARS